MSRCGLGRCSNHGRRYGRPSSAARNRSNSPRATVFASHPAWRPAVCRTTSSLITRNASPRTASASRRIICPSVSPLMSPTARNRRSANAVRKCSYFNRTLFSHGNFTETAKQRETGYSSRQFHRLRPTGKPACRGVQPRRLSQYDHGRPREYGRSPAPWCPPQEVAEKIIRLAEHTGAGTVQVNFNRGAMPQEMFVEQIRRFARDVLPIVQAHQITHVPGRCSLAA